VWTFRVYVSLFNFLKCFLNAGMPDCLASSQSGTGMKRKMLLLEPAGRKKGIQSCTGMLRYWMELPYDAMPMPAPAPSASMPMPSYGNETVNTASLKNFKIIGYNQCEKD
jgi:hypothetical protein